MDIVAIYHSLTVEPPKEERKPAKRTKAAVSDAPASDKAIGAYVAAAVDAECDAMRRAASGNRNDQLNASAFSLGTLIGAGVLDQSTVEVRLTEAAQACGLGEGEIATTMASGLEAGIAAPRDLTDVAESAARNPSYTPDLDVTGDDAQAFLDGGGEPAEWNPWPYGVKNGRLVYKSFNKQEELVESPIADFYASITEEITDEDGGKTFVIQGRALRGGEFSFEIPAKALAEDRTLRGLFEQGAGALDGVYNRMSGHLPKAIKSMTRKEELIVVRRFKRTGWYNGQFLLPGMIEDGRIELPAKLAYAIDAKADINTALRTLDNMLTAVDPSITTPVLSMLLAAPIHRLVGWHNERYGIFIQGRTGSLKTSWSQVAMCIYGREFINDTHLLKWGEGATRNAIMQYATAAHDMPFMLDNYKPNTGNGDKDFINLIQNILEGSDRDRLTRTSQLMASRPIHCFPLITGEDIPDSDSASLARLLVIAFTWQTGKPNPQLTAAQKDASHLPAIGREWLNWIATPDGQATISEVAKEFDACRTRWSNYLQSVRRDIGNPLRVATNLATNELSFAMALRHPVLGPKLKPYMEAHLLGLQAIAERMAVRTADALEAQLFLSAIRELLASKQYILIPRQAGDPSDIDRDRMLGWVDSEGVYLLPSIAIAAARRLLGHGSIPISAQALYGQLTGLDLIAMRGGDQTTRKISVGTSKPRVLHLRRMAIDNDDSGGDLLAELGV